MGDAFAARALEEGPCGVAAPRVHHHQTAVVGVTVRASFVGKVMDGSINECVWAERVVSDRMNDLGVAPPRIEAAASCDAARPHVVFAVTLGVV